MAWHRHGNKPLSEPVMVTLLTHMHLVKINCMTAFQWRHNNAIQSTRHTLCNTTLEATSAHTCSWQNASHVFWGCLNKLSYKYRDSYYKDKTVLRPSYLYIGNTYTGKNNIFTLRWSPEIFNSSPPGQNGRHLADDIFRCIFVNENYFILIKISLKFVPNIPIDNSPALV